MRDTVLLVDDEEIVRSVVKQILERLHYVVLTAVDRREVLDVFQRELEKMAFVLLDMSIPYTDGEKTLRDIRRMGADIPVILSSGYKKRDVLESLGDCSPDGFVEKPYDIATLAKEIERVTEAH